MFFIAISEPPDYQKYLTKEEVAMAGAKLSTYKSKGKESKRFEAVLLGFLSVLASPFALLATINVIF